MADGGVGECTGNIHVGESGRPTLNKDSSPLMASLIAKIFTLVNVVVPLHAVGAVRAHRQLGAGAVAIVVHARVHAERMGGRRGAAEEELMTRLQHVWPNKGRRGYARGSDDEQEGAQHQ